MKWGDFLNKYKGLPIIDSKLFLSSFNNISALNVQISRWVKSGKLIQLKRGLYILSEPYRKINVYEPYAAALLKNPSYVSLEKALEFYDLIPEAVAVYTSVTTKRPGKIVTQLGVFEYKHIKTALFWGYKAIIVDKQTAFMALPEKALLDYVYLRGMKISIPFLEELRLQNLDKIDFNILTKFGKKFEKPGILKVVEVIKKYADYCIGREKEL